MPTPRKPVKNSKPTTPKKSAKSGQKPARPKLAAASRTSTAAPESVPASSRIAALGLQGAAQAAAEKLSEQFPSIVFTSGRRDANQQASAMAGNVVRNRKWIQATYRATPESAALQAWVDANPAATTAAQIATGLLGIMSGWTDSQKKSLSRHFSGQAFDVQPVAGASGTAIKAAIRALPNLRQFLDKEGGLVIWHAEFE